MSDNKLILYPSDAWHILEGFAAFIETLRNIGLITDPFDYYGDIHHRPGEKFFKYIGFDTDHQWRSVILENESGNLKRKAVVPNRTQCHIAFIQPEVWPRIIFSAYTKFPPRCAECHKEIELYDDFLNAFVEKKLIQYSCPSCKTLSTVIGWDWDNTGAFARYQIDIFNIHYEEARPTQLLLGILEKCTGVAWKYIYYRF